MNLTAIILTRDEEPHIARAIGSVSGLADQVVVVDSGSTDRTVAIAEEMGAVVLRNVWRNHATQFNWALDHLPKETDWVLRLDADEIVTPELRDQIAAALPAIGSEIEGIVVGRRMTFLGRPIRHGGLFPVKVLRLFRTGRGRCEDRWMDEHIRVAGPTVALDGEILDDNRNSLTWWTAKHNAYASREVVDLLNLKLNFLPQETIADLRGGQAGVKRWLKERVYARLPAGLRSFGYFLYRYVLRGGFLDGWQGLAFHVLQGFWYRFLVDAKLREVEDHMNRTGDDPVTAIRTLLGVEL